MIRYFRCDKCGNLVESVHSSGVPMVCCGEKMRELVPGSVDAAVEKHVPVVSVEGSVVRVHVGSVTHPMTEEHLIEWIALETNRGVQRKTLSAGEAPEAVFALAEGEQAVAAYAYCNLHGLWKADC